jgi:WD40 repeat protein
VVGAAADGTVRTFSEPFATAGPSLKVGGAEVLRVAYSSTGKYFAAASPDGLRIWSGDLSLVYTSDLATLSAGFAPASDLLAAGLRDGRVLLVDAATGAVRWLEGHQAEVAALAFSRDRRHLASASWDGTVRVWEVETGASRRLAGTIERIQDVAFSPDGRRLAAAGVEGEIWVWDLVAETAQQLRGHTRTVRRLAFSADGRFLVSASWDGSGRVWNLADDSVAVLYVGDATPESELEALALLPDDSLLLVDTEEGYVRRWRLGELTFPPSGTREFRLWLEQQSSAPIVRSFATGPR